MIFFIVFIASFFLNASSYNNFYNVNELKSIKAFAKDIGGLTSSSLLYSARTLGFGGFSVSYKTSYQLKPSSNNSVLDRNRAFSLNFIQLETGFPYRIESFLRAGGNDGYNLIGGGIKYGLKTVTDEVYGINSLVSVYSHMGLYNSFYLVSFGGQISFSIKLSNVIIPFITGGIDSLKFKIKSHSDPSLVNKTFYDDIYRVGVGLRLKIGWFNASCAFEHEGDKRNIVEATAGLRF